MKSNIVKLAIATSMLFGSASAMATGSVQHLSQASAHSAHKHR